MWFIAEIQFFNACRTHFVINVDTGRSLGFSGSQKIQWADLVSGGELITILERLSVDRNVQIEPTFMDF